jgi:hypothetical protein
MEFSYIYKFKITITISFIGILKRIVDLRSFFTSEMGENMFISTFQVTISVQNAIFPNIMEK